MLGTKSKYIIYVVAIVLFIALTSIVLHVHKTSAPKCLKPIARFVQATIVSSRDAIFLLKWGTHRCMFKK